MSPPTASGRISEKQYKRGSPNFKHFSGRTSLTNLPHMTSLAASGQLQNAIKHCTKVWFDARSPVMTHLNLTECLLRL